MALSMLVASFLIFSFIHFIPGDPAAIMLGDLATAEEIDQLRESMGLNRPIAEQYVIWLGNALTGNLGNSVFFQTPVMKIIGEHLEVSLLLAFFSFILVLLIGIPVGIISAAFYDTKIDRLCSGVTLFFASAPTFLVGLYLILIVSVKWGWLPSSGFPSILETGELSGLKYLILPALTLAFPNSALIVRMVRSSMLDTLKEDYVRTARAKGISEFNVYVKHIFRYAMLSVVTALGFTFVALVSGTVVTETVFALPGVGRLVVDSVLRRDYPVIQGVVLVIVLCYLLINFVVDLFYAILDPRINLQ